MFLTSVDIHFFYPNEIKDLDFKHSIKVYKPNLISGVAFKGKNLFVAQLFLSGGNLTSSSFIYIEQNAPDQFNRIIDKLYNKRIKALTSQ